MSESEAKQLAEAIAADLFTNGTGERAERLVLFDANRRDLGGWSERAATKRIKEILLAATKEKS